MIEEDLQEAERRNQEEVEKRKQEEAAKQSQQSNGGGESESAGSNSGYSSPDIPELDVDAVMFPIWLAAVLTGFLLL